MAGVKYTAHGLKELRQRLLSIRSDALAQRLRDEAGEEFVRAMRRRTIPEDTGRLKASLTQRGHRDHLARLSGLRIELGSRVPYAGYQAKRWRPLTSQERQDIFVKPLLRAIMAQMLGKSGGGA